MSALRFSQLFHELTPLLEATGRRWFVGGSVASTMHGEPRTTIDVDIVIDLRVEDVADLAAALKQGFYADEDMIREAVARRSSCNVVHHATGLKVDLYVLRDREYASTELERSAPEELLPGVAVRMATAEDCVLSKLEWYRKGNEVSDRQWRDVQGILKAKRAVLDFPYLRRWAPELGVADLLERAFADAGIAG